MPLREMIIRAKRRGSQSVRGRVDDDASRFSATLNLVLICGYSINVLYAAVVACASSTSGEINIIIWNL